MKYKESMGEIFRNYASSNPKKNQIDYEVQSEIGYLKQVLTGERRKKQDGGFWTWDSRIKEANRAFNCLNKNVLAISEVGVIEEMFDTAFKNKYFARKFENAGRDSDLCIISKNIASTIENYFGIYLSIKDNYTPVVQRESLETITTKEEKSLVGAGARTRLATVALLATLGLGILTGIGVKGYADRKIIQEKESRIEQLVQERRKPDMAIVTDLPSEELDKRYEKYAAGGKKILDLRYYVPEEESKDSIEYYTNKGQNKGNFGKGFMYSTNKMQIPPENKKYTPEKKAELNKRFSNIDEKVRKEQKRFEQGIHEVVSLKHPFKGLWKTFTGFGGQLNGVARGFTRPIIYFFTRNDKIDRAIDNFADASYFGDSYNELHSKILKPGEFISRVKKHPIKSTISIGEDIWLGKLLHWHGDEGSSVGSSITSILGRGMGRSGGAGTP